MKLVDRRRELSGSDIHYCYNSIVMDINVCVFGASIVWGAWDSECGGWVNRLFMEEAAKPTSAENFLDIYNLGVSGNTTVDLLGRIKSEALARKAHVIIISIGINDAAFIASENKNMTPIDDFETNLALIVAAARSISTNTLLVGLTSVDEARTMPVYWNEDLYYRNEDIIQYDKAMEKVAIKMLVPYLKIRDVLTPDDLDDGLHPNSVGHKKISLLVKNFVEDVVQVDF